MYLTLEVAVYSIGLSMYKGGVCAVFFVVVMLGVGVCLVARRRRAAREASNSVQQLEALKELSLKLNPQGSNPEL